MTIKKAAPKKGTKKIDAGIEESFLNLDDLELTIAEGAELVCAFRLGRDIGVISVNSFNGSKALDIRRFYMNDDMEAYAPTAKGIRIPIALAPEVITRLHAVHDAVAAHATP
jgi:hypothetical protein